MLIPYIVKYLLAPALRVFFRRMYLTGFRENWPKGKPVIVAANHPNAFTDSILLKFFFIINMRVLVRADVFSSPAARYILNGIKLLPVYRERDGVENLKKNDALYDYCYELLAEKKSIIIHIESDSEAERRLRPFKKGLARMAFGAEEKNDWDLDLHVVPIGISYTHFNGFRATGMVNVAKPFPLREYQEMYAQHPAKALRKLTNDLRASIEKEVIIIDKQEDEQLAERMFRISRNDHPEATLWFRSSSKEKFNREKALADSVNALRKTDPEGLEVFRAEMKTYFDELRAEGISDEYFSKRKISPDYWLFYLLGWPFLLTGLIFTIPLRIGYNISEKKASGTVFYASVFMGIVALVWPLFWLPILVGSFIWGNPFFIAFALLLPVISRWGTFYPKVFRMFRTRFRANAMKRRHKDRYAALKAMRNKIREKMYGRVDGRNEVKHGQAS